MLVSFPYTCKSALHYICSWTDKGPMVCQSLNYDLECGLIYLICLGTGGVQNFFYRDPVSNYKLERFLYRGGLSGKFCPTGSYSLFLIL